MRGFNLFAAFLGVVMLAIAVGFTVFTGTQEAQALREISTQVQTVSVESVADLIRQDAHNTVVETIRRSFQDFFATNPVEPLADAWGSESEFKRWFSEDFIAESKLTEHIADALSGELLLYQGLPLKGHTVRVVVNRSALAEALKEGSSIIVQDDGTFVFVYDTSKLTPEAIASLPTIVIDGKTTVSVFPPGRWMISVPLRIVEAYRHAKEFGERVEAHRDEFKILFGSCSRDSVLCALWRWTGWDVSPVYPQEVGKGYTITTSEVGEGTWRAYNLVGGACTDMRLYTDESELNQALGVEEIPCSQPEIGLVAVLQKRLEKLVEDPDANAYIVLDSIKAFKTWRVVSDEEINISRLVGESVGIPYLDWVINKLLSAVGVRDAVSISPCRPSGYLYCAAPAALTYDYVWTDKDTRYSVTGEPAVFVFRRRMEYPFAPIYTWLKAREERVAPVSVTTQSVDIGYDPQECEKNMMDWCREQIKKGIDACTQIQASRLDEPWRSIAMTFIGLGSGFESLCNQLGGYAALIPACLGPQFQDAYVNYATADWDEIRHVGHALYEEYNKAGDEECAALFAAFKDENALCMDPNQNFCEHLRWLQSGVPKCDLSDPSVVARSVFWFHPFSEFAASCMPAG